MTVKGKLRALPPGSCSEFTVNSEQRDQNTSNTEWQDRNSSEVRNVSNQPYIQVQNHLPLIHLVCECFHSSDPERLELGKHFKGNLLNHLWRDTTRYTTRLH